MHQGQLVFSQLMRHLPLTTFRRCVARYAGEHKVKLAWLTYELLEKPVRSRRFKLLRPVPLAGAIFAAALLRERHDSRFKAR
jgi:hypothetical protein